MIRRNLYHAVIIFGTQIHEVIVHGVDNLTLHVYLVVQMRTGALARTAYSADDFTTHHLLTRFCTEIAQVGIHV